MGKFVGQMSTTVKKKLHKADDYAIHGQLSITANF
jgi:hypothetical protein